MSARFAPRQGLIVRAQVYGPKDQAQVGYDLAQAIGQAPIVTGSSIETVPVLMLSQIDALGHTRTNMPIHAYTLPAAARVDGVLGLDYLRGQTLTINFRTGLLSLTQWTQHTMKHTLALLCAALAIVPMTAHAAPKRPAKPAPAHAKPSAKSPAVQAADAWLALVDNAQYDKSWDTAAAAFKAQVTAAQWTAAMQQVRAPLGSVKTRTFASAKRTTNPPGAPAGDYAIIQYSTVFANKTTVETLTPMKDADGQWRVSGYFIR